MSLTTSTTWTNLIQEVLLPQVESTFYQNNSLFSIWTPEKHAIGDSIDWAIDYGPATDYSATYDQGDPAPNPNIETILKGTVAKQPFQVLAKISKVALDYMGGNKLGMSDPIMMDVAQKTAQLMNTVNTTLLANFEAAVDSTGSYDGNSRATYTGLASYEAAPNTTATLAHWEDCWEALIDNDRGVDPANIISLTAWNQITNYVRLATGASNMPFNHTSGQVIDGGRLAPGCMFNGRPVYGIGDMTDTTLLMGDKTKVAIYEARGITIEEKSVMADEIALLITCNYQIVVKNTQKWGKTTGLTA
jgi:hypothetical protein